MQLADAADVMSRNPSTLQLRYLQTLMEIGSGNKSSVVIPLPIDLIQPLLPQYLDGSQSRQGEAAADGIEHSEAVNASNGALSTTAS